MTASIASASIDKEIGIVPYGLCFVREGDEDSNKGRF